MIIPFNSLLKRRTPEAYTGRVFGIGGSLYECGGYSWSSSRRDTRHGFRTSRSILCLG
ncbi:hypothetical protein [Paenibacillus graminis]|uniref:hypothetical protein n=1 Tax=Paenibacillus graminis TaxID=189425 RepID=UPI000A46AF9D|nr:hypothetical protein [Paenibacillus graminis]